MKIADMKVTELINEVGAGTPAPGGGAVAGLAGGVGVALTMMVNGLTLDKKGFENDRERLLDAIAKGNELKERFIHDAAQINALSQSSLATPSFSAHTRLSSCAVQIIRSMLFSLSSALLSAHAIEKICSLMLSAIRSSSLLFTVRTAPSRPPDTALQSRKCS